jgi:short-subunit dehydrogenase
MPRALVTGGTSGIGAAFARHYAAAGHDLVLVARDAERLELTAATLRAAHGVEVETIPADLTDREALGAVAARLQDDTRPVDVLVNNAGFALRTRFLRNDPAVELALLDVLVRAVLVLSRAAAPGMIARGRGAIVTVSSVSGFAPMGTYSAAKAWATTFTRGLAGELAGTGVTATALCPGFTRTEFHSRAGIRRTGSPGWLWLDADAVVAECLRDVARGRAVSIPSRRYRALVLVLRHAPLALQERWLAGRKGRMPLRD